MTRNRKSPSRGLSFGRSSERSVGHPGASSPAGVLRPEEPPRSYFETLMSVALTSTYYNASHLECRDFSIEPTAFSAYQMRALGLLLHQEPARFSILYDRRREAGLLRYLAREANDPQDPSGSWARLSFVLALENPDFVNFTRETPLDLNPMERNFYFSNLALEPAPEARPAQPLAWSAALPVVPTYWLCHVGPEVAAIEIRNIAGEVVQCRPRCPSTLVGKRTVNPAAIQCRDLEELSLACSNDTIHFNFSLLPEDRYSVTKIDPAGQPVEPSFAVLYTSASPIPLAFIDLLFAQPRQPGGSSGAFPVSPDYDAISRVDYRLEFQARATFWRYYIVPPTVGDWELEIDSTGTNPPTRFTPARPTLLPDGSRGYELVSEEALALLQDSPYAFALRGSEISTGDSIHIARLPVASVQQVLPISDPGPEAVITPYSDIYVYV